MLYVVMNAVVVITESRARRLELEQVELRKRSGFCQETGVDLGADRAAGSFARNPLVHLQVSSNLTI